MKWKNKRLVQWLCPAVVMAALIWISALLLKGDKWIFWTWYLIAALLGMIFMPVTGKLFEGFADKGWMFSKVLAIAACGFFTWLLVSLKILPFTTLTCVGICVCLALVCAGVFYGQCRKKQVFFPVWHGPQVFWEEILFFAAFLMWTYLVGFHPAVYGTGGTEKFMDYGFMEAMMRSTTLPARDLWYSQGHINYYYGGQYFAVFLTKITGGEVEKTYNLMRSFIAGLAFVLPFSLTYQMLKDRLAGNLPGKRNGIRKCFPAAAGVTAGVAVSIAGNMHYVIYYVILPWIDRLRGTESTDSYWFPNATRYIGYNPDVPDKTIHEFPCYSFILGDLHAHVVNIMFVLFLTGLLYAAMKKLRSRERCGNEKAAQQGMVRQRIAGADLRGKAFWKGELCNAHILLAAAFLGMFQWTNFWDFVIYFVVTGGVVLFCNLIRFEGKARVILAVTAAQAAEVLLVSYVVSLPFTLQFETMVLGVAFAQNHSLPYQLLVLWGLPAILTVMFLICLLWERRRDPEKKTPWRFLEALQVPDLFVTVTGLCALGLVLIPELVYVRDIYEAENARANTMFKLTYQAFILFGITMGYVIFRMFGAARQIIFKIISLAGLLCLLWTVGYFGLSVRQWFGDVFQTEDYQGLDALALLESNYPEDAGGIRWLKENVQGAPVVLEANGDSYTDYNRVSATTGLPTVLGWYVHEWLWRNDVEDLNNKSADVENIYTSSNEALVRELLEEYDVSYVFIGSMEREKYGERLNTELLGSIGRIVYEDPQYDTCILQVD